jgi:acyl carrier protein
MDRMTETAILDLVIAQVRETLSVTDREGDSVSSASLLFYDLSFTSMDLLDLLYRLEQLCEITIPEGTLYGLARGDMPEASFAAEGVLSGAGRARLMRLLHDTPAALFAERIHAATLPRYCTVGAIARLVEHALALREPSSS